ncbi:hypothetical protein [Sporosarcina highlanderae]|uniref:Lipoprotein n=1 Tax=Sporosarcina highlanderae TaxID=3035916 RepID=A0ABT8JRC9_9BACL|nr:hypothetical protein [Sporosarcina highlanderae]MDN4607624.1 hypothetical protein [Sporosarcina highlanderae]
MRIYRLTIALLLTTLLVMGCSNKTTTLNNSGNSGESNDSDQVTENGKNQVKETVDESLKNYFLPEGSKAHFHGEGNEFAEFDMTFAMPYENIVGVHVNNGGAIIRYIYKIEKDQITTINHTAVDMNADFPSLEEIEAMKPEGVYLKKPFKVGTTFGKWKITETDVTVETPYQTFDNAFVIESEENNAVNRKYFVEGYGEVKRESIMEAENNQKFIVSSTLESVSKP